MAAVLAGILSRTSPAAARIFPATADELKTTKSQGNSHKVCRTERNVRRNLNDVRTKNGKIIYRRRAAPFDHDERLQEEGEEEKEEDNDIDSR